MQNITWVSEKLHSPNQFDNIKNLKENIMSWMVVDVSFLEGRIVGCSKCDELPSDQYKKSKSEHQEQRNVQIHEITFFEEIVRVLHENWCQFDLFAVKHHVEYVGNSD